MIRKCRAKPGHYGAIEKFLDKIAKPSRYGICPEPTTDSEALNILYDLLLDKEGYLTTMPLSHDQINTEAISWILDRHYKSFKSIRKSIKDRYI